MLATLQRLFVEHSRPLERKFHALLKPPEPQIAVRRFYVRIEEPLTLTMERYAEFLGTASIDHVVTQALQFIFKRDTQFRSWLEQNPEPPPKPAKPKAGSKSTAPDGGAQ